MVQNNDIVTFENVEMFNGARNFKGDRFNDGKRSFGIFLNPEIAEQMKRDGWPIKYTNPPKNGEVPSDWEARPWLKVHISYKFRPPTVVQITARGRTMLDEESVDVLDWAPLKHVDLSVRSRFWEMNGNTGLKAMLHEFYATLEESPLALKYGAFDEEYEQPTDNEDD